MRLGLVGKGIMNSSSPELHVQLGELTGIATSYDLFDADEIPMASLESQIRALVKEGYRGVNVTYPFKSQAVNLASRVSAGARMIGSANTLVFEEGSIRAENTDFSGFISGFHATLGARKPGRVLLLGAGGVGKAVAFGLGRLGARQVVVMDLDEHESRRLANDMREAGFSATSADSSALEEQVAQCDGLVNCTPIGHEKSPGCPIPQDLIEARHWVFDAVYVPAVTEFTAAATAVGAEVMSGVSLFVFQGVDAFKLFCGDADKSRVVDQQAGILFTRYKQDLLREQGA